MTEKRAEYGVPVSCPECDIEIGTIIEQRGRAWLRVGCLELYAAHGRCGSCGTEWHWTASEMLLKRIVEQSRKPPVM
jgi:hypothetical protein